MKLFFSILFSVFYLTSTSGVSINTHYCGGKIKHISFFKHSEKNCCGKKKMSKNCCKDKKAYFKVKDTHESNSVLKSPLPFDKTGISTLSVFQYHFSAFNTDRIVLSDHAPPVIYDNPLYLKHKVLLI